MKVIVLMCCLIPLTFLVSGQGKQDINLGSVDSIYSKILQEQREIWVYVPHSYSPGKKYPVVYLLDATQQFYSFVGLVDFLSQSNGNTLCPEMIIIGIPNTNRTRDLTPFKGDTNDRQIPAEMINASGGGENFLSFIEKELIPHVEEKYPTAPYRMFIGHSFGGLTVLYTLLHHPEMFNAYVSIDPSVIWGKSRLLNEYISCPPDKRFENKTLFLGLANIEKGLSLDSLLSDTSWISKHLQANVAMDEYFRGNGQNGLKYSSRFYANERHTTVPLIAEYDALHFIFDFYDLGLSYEDFEDPDAEVADKIRGHNALVTDKLGFETRPDENLVNSLGYQFLFSSEYPENWGIGRPEQVGSTASLCSYIN